MGALEATGIVFPEVRRTEWERRRLPAPDELEPTQVLVRTACALLNAGTEIAIYTGTHIGYTIPGATYPRLPYRPGWAFAGTVEAVGSAVTTVQPGDRVGGSSSFGD